MYDIVSLAKLPNGIQKHDKSCEVLFVPNPSAIDRAILQNARILHTGSSSLVREPARSSTYEAIDIAKHAGAVISYAPDDSVSLWGADIEAIRFMRSLICMADILLAAEAELSLLTSETDPEKTADALADQGVRIIIIPLADHETLLRVGSASRTIHTNLNLESYLPKFLCGFAATKKSLREITLDEVSDFLTVQL